MSGDLTVAVLQLTSTDDVEANIKSIKKLIDEAPLHTQFFCLPENALWMRMVEGGKITPFTLQDEVFSELTRIARQRKAWIHIGSAPIQQNKKATNSSVLVTPNGEVKLSYKKIHLFDIELDGQPPIRESDVFEAGQNPQILDLNGWSVGQTICYDLRFAELFNFYAQHQVDLILVPSAFLVPTGKAHWEVLLRARAIESQVYIIAAAQAGHHKGRYGGERYTYGHSLIVDPWGNILAQGSGDQNELLTISLTKEKIQSVRQQIPMKHHRKLVAIKN